ncbi:MAG TPA: hypothetical protein VFK61_08160 [Candidatus Limnocylindria bacterium]|nr:hypothetical protein [Candidatus Limnocylindria bacterium]
MPDEATALPEIPRGVGLRGPDGRRIGTVDAVFADYLLVRTSGLLPVDLYVPRTEVTLRDGTPTVALDRGAAYEAWHRPLKQAPHD